MTQTEKNNIFFTQVCILWFLYESRDKKGILLPLTSPLPGSLLCTYP